MSLISRLLLCQNPRHYFNPILQQQIHLLCNLYCLDWPIYVLLFFSYGTHLRWNFDPVEDHNPWVDETGMCRSPALTCMLNRKEGKDNLLSPLDLSFLYNLILSTNGNSLCSCLQEGNPKPWEKICLQSSQFHCVSGIGYYWISQWMSQWYTLPVKMSWQSLLPIVARHCEIKDGGIQISWNLGASFLGSHEILRGLRWSTWGNR